MRRFRAPSVTLAAILALALGAGGAHATFSIVAVDLSTGEVGGAGASCIANSFIINDLIEGVGAIHTQALWSSCNQNRVHDRMVAGDSPDQIIAYISTNDCNGFGCGMNPCDETHRQYIVVDSFGSGRSAGWTGSSTLFYADHILGPDYAIAGNILLDPTMYDVLAEMEIAFNAASGTLAERLMAALQGANVPQADSRCPGRPAISAFVKVVKATGDPLFPYLELNVASTAPSENPIDTLQALYDVEPAPDFSDVTIDTDRLKANGKATATITVTPRNFSDLVIGAGRNVAITNSGGGIVGAVTDNLDGTYSAVLTSDVLKGTDTITVSVDGAAGPVTLDAQILVTYFKKRSSGGGGCATLGAAGGGDLLSKLLGAYLPLLAVLICLLVPVRRPRPRLSAG